MLHCASHTELTCLFYCILNTHAFARQSTQNDNIMSQMVCFVWNQWESALLFSIVRKTQRIITTSIFRASENSLPINKLKIQALLRNPEVAERATQQIKMIVYVAHVGKLWDCLTDAKFLPWGSGADKAVDGTDARIWLLGTIGGAMCAVGLRTETTTTQSTFPSV